MNTDSLQGKVGIWVKDCSFLKVVFWDIGQTRTLGGLTGWLKRAGSVLRMRLDATGTLVERCTCSTVQAIHCPPWKMSAIPFTISWQARAAAAAGSSSGCAAGLHGSGHPLSPAAISLPNTSLDGRGSWPGMMVAPLTLSLTHRVCVSYWKTEFPAEDE